MYSVASLKAKMCAEPDCFFLLTVYVGHSKSSPEDATDKIKKPADFYFSFVIKLLLNIMFLSKPYCIVSIWPDG